MSLDMQLRTMPNALDTDADGEPETIWIENLVAGAAMTIAVLFVSSLAVLMYLA